VKIDCRNGKDHWGQVAVSLGVMVIKLERGQSVLTTCSNNIPGKRMNSTWCSAPLPVAWLYCKAMFEMRQRICSTV
jgi:hypothetical protein